MTNGQADTSNSFVPVQKSLLANFKPFYCCLVCSRRTSFCSSRSAHPVLQAVLCSPCIANVLKSHFKDVQPGLFFIRIFRVLNTVQSFIFKVHVVAASAATCYILSQRFLSVNNFFHFFLFLKMSTLNSTFFHVFIVLPFCTIRNLFYCIFSLLGSAIVRLPLLPASHAPYFRSYASCFTSSSNSSPAE